MIKSLQQKLILFLITFLILSAFLIGTVAYLDPWFLYHAPRKEWYYRLSNERCQSPGVARHFDYDALIVGSSLIRDIHTSRFDELYGTHSVKLPISGTTWRETGEVLRAAFESGNRITMVVRPLDVNHLIEDKDWVRWDLGEYPYYLYDRNPWNDIRYLCNRDILLDYCLPMIRWRVTGQPGGHTPFDSYGLAHVAGGYVPAPEEIGLPIDPQLPFTQEDADLLTENLTENLLRYVDAHPDTDFYLYLPTYGVVWWSEMLGDGTFERTMDATALAVDLMLSHPNIRLYCYGERFELTDDLTQYADEIHYSEEIAHQMLEWMASDEGRLTSDNAEEILQRIRIHYREYDYEGLRRDLS